jgi:hypothetical protein
MKRNISPSEWASKVAGGTSRNAWRDLWFKEPLSKTWVPAQLVRDQAQQEIQERGAIENGEDRLRQNRLQHPPRTATQQRPAPSRGTPTKGRPRPVRQALSALCRCSKPHYTVLEMRSLGGS